MTARRTEPREVDLGALFGDAWRALRPNLSAFVMATLAALSVLLLSFLPLGLVLFAEEEGLLDPATNLAGEYATHAVAGVTMQWLLLGGLRMCVSALRGQRVGVSDVFDAGGAVVPGMAAAVLVNLITALGAMLCVVPGIVWACATAVVQLFVVDKRLGPLAAVRASFAATKGHRFTVFALLVCMYVLVIVGLLAFAVGLLVAVPLWALALAALYERTWPTARPDA